MIPLSRAVIVMDEEIGDQAFVSGCFWFGVAECKCKVVGEAI